MAEAKLGLLTEQDWPHPLSIRCEPIGDHYDLDSRPFARGKFAQVKRCQHKKSGVEFAAKYIRKRRRATDVTLEILHEIRILQLAAPCTRIIDLFEVFETPQEFVLLLEMAGGELQQWLDKEEVIPEVPCAQNVVRQVLEAISFLHQNNLAHLDIKPQNVLVSGSFPDCDIIKLCDFGISRVITKGSELREIVGTPDYVAPEILHYEPISLATDMWSIGVLTYVLLSGFSPFGGDNKQETYCNITNGKLEFPANLFGDVSEEAIDFMRKLLVRDPKMRMSCELSLAHEWLDCETKKQVSNSPQNTDGVQLLFEREGNPTDSESDFDAEKENLNQANGSLGKNQRNNNSSREKERLREARKAGVGESIHSLS